MVLLVRQSEWAPSAGVVLEPNAKDVLKSTENCLVTAGPGAGKTELLAQRASYLLQTGLCPEPKRVLAISFKRDAASNLRNRVGMRCGKELATRFDSFTYDAFAKSLVDRFLLGLPAEYRPPADYEIAVTSEDYNRLGLVVSKLLADLSIPPELRDAGKLRNLDIRFLVNRGLCAARIKVSQAPSNALEWGIPSILRSLIAARPCTITFDIIKRLALLLFELNPLLLEAMRATYSHVFLDEFQDTTYVQYDLLIRCFVDSESVVTAVGDNKQRIMLWANAMPNGFELFQRHFNAQVKQLVLNHRSHPELVRIQQYLVAAIDPACQPSAPANAASPEGSACQILSFASPEAEAAWIVDLVKDRLSKGVAPADICLLSRIKPDSYMSVIIPTIRAEGIKCRLEDEYQDLLKDEAVCTILAILHLATGERSPTHWEEALDCVCMLDSVNTEDNRAIYSAEDRLALFLSGLSKMMETCGQDCASDCVDAVLGFLGQDKIRANFPQHRNHRSSEFLMGHFKGLLTRSYKSTQNWRAALEDFEGIDTIPAMTIHKSKGLEYDTVIFVGLEDSAWMRFAEQKEEHTCAFFVAFSRAKTHVYFTFCRSRAVWKPNQREIQGRSKIASLYQLLQNAGVKEIQHDT